MDKQYWRCACREVHIDTGKHICRCGRHYLDGVESVVVLPATEAKALLCVKDAIRAEPTGFATVRDYRHYLLNVALDVYENTNEDKP